MQKKIVIMGSTGNIGCQTLDIIRQDRLAGNNRFAVLALSSGKNVLALAEQVQEFNPLFVHIADDKSFQLAQGLPSFSNVKLVTGAEGWQQILAASPDLVVHSIFGRCGLKPLLQALEAGINVAFAGKEALISGGPLVIRTAEQSKAQLLPIDSEHNSIYRCLTNCQRSEVKKIILTASGGPLRNADEHRLRTITAAEAARHPNWNMGERISINSATLVNKGLEVIEAHYLFKVPIKHIEVLLHPQSIVHGIVQFTDGSVLMHAALPDMRIPIAFCLDYPNLVSEFEPLDLVKIGQLEFEEVNTAQFRAIELFKTAAELSWIAPAILNIANELWLDEFIAGKTQGILGCYEYLEQALNLVPDYLNLEPSFENWCKVELEIVSRLKKN